MHQVLTWHKCCMDNYSIAWSLRRLPAAESFPLQSIEWTTQSRQLRFVTEVKYYHTMQALNLHRRDAIT